MNGMSLNPITEMSPGRSATPQAEVAATRSVSVLHRAIAHGVTLSVGVDTPAARH